jgi:hypothetical protein
MSSRYNPAQRRYNMRVIWLSLAYAGLLMGAIYGFNHHMFAGALAYGAAILWFGGLGLGALANKLTIGRSA